MASGPKTPYEEGSEAARIPPPDQPECPYAVDTPERAKWWDGYGDTTEDLIRYNGGEDEGEG